MLKIFFLQLVDDIPQHRLHYYYEIFKNKLLFSFTNLLTSRFQKMKQGKYCKNCTTCILVFQADGLFSFNYIGLFSDVDIDIKSFHRLGVLQWVVLSSSPSLYVLIPLFSSLSDPLYILSIIFCSYFAVPLSIYQCGSCLGPYDSHLCCSGDGFRLPGVYQSTYRILRMRRMHVL